MVSFAETSYHTVPWWRVIPSATRDHQQRAAHSDNTPTSIDLIKADESVYCTTLWRRPKQSIRSLPSSMMLSSAWHAWLMVRMWTGRVKIAYTHTHTQTNTKFAYKQTWLRILKPAIHINYTQTTPTIQKKAPLQGNNQNVHSPSRNTPPIVAWVLWRTLDSWLRARHGNEGPCTSRL